MTLDVTLRRAGYALTLGAAFVAATLWVASASGKHHQTDENTKNLSIVVRAMAKQATAEEAEQQQIRKFCKLGKLASDSEECQLVD